MTDKQNVLTFLLRKTVFHYIFFKDKYYCYLTSLRGVTYKYHMFFTKVRDERYLGFLW